ncbi:UDP-glucosyltransferase 2-like [Drosophila takahashii]|uniref:UDP-glucosyltransferase 2-like n=1 Tax=Drosophila takahashii TaxID=29030 RepID=UPI001CF88683|nr:UDP-glucosyltransferase 2-like [Drosophila takahashii]
MRVFYLIACVLCALGSKPLPTDSAKILATFPFPGRSQYIFLETYLRELAARGHQVTVINTFRNAETPNMTFIEAYKAHDHREEMMELLNESFLWQVLNAWDKIVVKFTEIMLDNEGVRKLLESGETFDLVLVEMEQIEALYGLAQHFNATLAGFLSFGTDHRVDEAFGNISPISYSPLVASSRTDRMSFWERLLNHYEYLVEKIHRHLVHLPAMQKMYDRYFPNAKQTFVEVLNIFAMVLIGQHFSLSNPRPYLPTMIEVGGLHINREPKVLPKDIKEFIEGSPQGVIYFSMGSNVKYADLTQETQRTLLETFGKLKQRVLWKFDNDEWPEKPGNVMIRKWFPQADVLAHPNVKIFITHGGQLSTFESVYFGKPILGLPCYFDQHMNVLRATRMGFGLSLDVKNLKQKDLQHAIQTLLSDPSFAKASQEISARYHDQPQSPLERAIWWTEYVIRHKDASHLRAASRDLTFIQLHSLDTLAVLLGLPLLVAVIILKLCRKTLWKHSAQAKKLKER